MASRATAEFNATIRFVGDAVEPDAISAMLGVRPTAAHRKGEVVAQGEVIVQELSRTHEHKKVPGRLVFQVGIRFRNMTWEEIEAGKRQGLPGYGTIRKLLTDLRFER